MSTILKRILASLMSPAPTHVQQITSAFWRELGECSGKEGGGGEGKGRGEEKRREGRGEGREGERGGKGRGEEREGERRREGRGEGREGEGREGKGRGEGREGERRGKRRGGEGRRDPEERRDFTLTCNSSLSTCLLSVRYLFSSEALNSPVTSFNI